MKGYVPCGACRAYVPAAAGCTHWRPTTKQAMSTIRSQAARRKAKAKLEAARQSRRR